MSTKTYQIEIDDVGAFVRSGNLLRPKGLPNSSNIEIIKSIRAAIDVNKAHERAFQPTWNELKENASCLAYDHINALDLTVKRQILASKEKGD